MSPNPKNHQRTVLRKQGERYQVWLGINVMNIPSEGAEKEGGGCWCVLNNRRWWWSREEMWFRLWSQQIKNIYRVGRTRPNNASNAETGYPGCCTSCSSPSLQEPDPHFEPLVLFLFYPNIPSLLCVDPLTHHSLPNHDASCHRHVWHLLVIFLLAAINCGCFTWHRSISWPIRAWVSIKYANKSLLI